MKKFKSYLTEVSEYNPVMEAHANIARILSDFHTKSQIPHPNRQGETIGFYPPTYNIMEGGKVTDGVRFGGKLSRRYRWNNWNSALSALSTAMSAQHMALGNSTGNHQGRDLSSEEIRANHNLVLGRFAPAIKAFEDQHQIYLEDISMFHPEIKTNLDALRRMGHSIEQANAIQFNNALNKKLVNHQGEIAQRFGGRTGEIHDELQNFFTIENNRAVTAHNHPLGLMLSGGLSGNPSKPVVEEPHPTDRYGWVDISHKYEH